MRASGGGGAFNPSARCCSTGPQRVKPSIFNVAALPNSRLDLRIGSIFGDVGAADVLRAEVGRMAADGAITRLSEKNMPCTSADQARSSIS